IQNVYIGSGVTDTNTSASSVVLNATGGSGLNVAGANISLAGGIGTGTGVGGNINFEIAKPSITSGSTSNTLAQVGSISGTNGAVSFENSANSSNAFQIQNSDGESILQTGTSASTNYVLD